MKTFNERELFKPGDFIIFEEDSGLKKGVIIKQGSCAEITLYDDTYKIPSYYVIESTKEGNLIISHHLHIELTKIFNMLDRFDRV
jgi:hypothetical protein